MDCHISENKANCNCTYAPCHRKGRCCECISYHLAGRQLPACYFPASIEKTFDRSFERFAQAVNRGEI